MKSKPSFFESPPEFREWLERNHDSAEEVVVGLHKKGSRKPSITLREAQDEALCFGWIDGVARSIDENSWAIRFTPRRPGSVWSAVNIKRAEALIAEGRMTPAGLAQFEKRDEKRVRQYSYERENPQFDAASEKQFRANKEAWDFFRAQPAGYQRLHTWWVMRAKGDPTRAKRL
ncbi:MAG: YdeI/OmpD-associated family protein, partial [bacterium]